MPYLRWFKPQIMMELVSRAVVPNQTPIIMQARDSVPPTAEFRLLRAYSPFGKGIRAMAGKTEFADLNDVFTAAPLTSEPTTLRSNSFPLDSGGQCHTHRWKFKDDIGTFSSQLRTSRFVDVQLGVETPAALVPHFPIPLPKFIVKGRIAAVCDPSIQLSIISPMLPNERYSFDQVLDAELDEVSIDSTSDSGDVLVLASVIEQFRNASEGWEVWVDEASREFEIEPGEVIDFTVNITPGAQGFFPFVVIAVGEGKDDFAVSNVVVAQYDNNNGFQLLFGEEELDE